MWWSEVANHLAKISAILNNAKQQIATNRDKTGTTRYFGLSLYDNENDFYSLCTYERRTTYRSLSSNRDIYRVRI